MSSYTRQAIMDAFLRLLARKPFKKITVRDIVEECGVNRTTFYYYYQDIYAIVEDLFSVTLTAYADLLRGEGSEESLRDTSHFVEMNRPAFLSLWDALGHEQVRKYAYAVTDGATREFIARRAEGLTVSEQELNTVFLLVREALFGAVYLFLRGDLPDGAGATLMRSTHGLTRRMLTSLAAEPTEENEDNATPGEVKEEL